MLSSADTIEKHEVWTFASDESGAFEEASPYHVLGGMLLPGTPERSEAMLDEFRASCMAAGLSWPPHSAHLQLPERARLRAKAVEHVARLGGIWLFVVANAKDPDEAGPSLALYIQMLTATTDLAGRLASVLGAKQLHFRPAQRMRELPGEAVERGLATRVPGYKAKTARAMSEAEMRGTLDALRREPAGALPPYPEPATVHAESAGEPDVHPAVALADIGCNALLFGLTSEGALLEFQSRFQPAVVVTLRATHALRAIDRALRDSPAALMPAAKLVTHLAADAAGAPRNPGDLQGLRTSSSHCAELLWSAHVKNLAEVADAGACARALLADAEVELGGRSASYEGLAKALSTAWSDEGALLAQRQRLELRDRVLQARLWRATLDSANHRGDLATARQAIAGFDAILRGGRSLMLLALEFHVRSLAVVTVQNELPFEAKSAERIRSELASRTQALAAAADHAATLVGADPASGAVSQDPPEEERKLWQHACGTEPGFATPDLELGMAFGTQARSLAFLGRHDDALRASMAARARFTNMAFELEVNAAVISRIELDRARCDPEGARKRAGLLEAALRLCGAEALARGTSLPDLQERPAARFTLDIALRALLWAPHVRFEAKPLFDWIADDEFIRTLSRGKLRSHPSELLARHAAELLRRHQGRPEAIRQLFWLSRQLCEEHPASSTLGRLGRFTAKLHEAPSFESEGPAGSILNPSFEYR